MSIALKLLLLVSGIVAVVGILGILKLLRVLSLNGREREPEEQIYEGNGQGNVLLLYQPSSHESVCVMAKAAAEVFQEMGYAVTLNYPSAGLTYDLRQFQVIGCGSAVYAGSVSAVLLRYMKEHPFAGKMVLLFAVGSDTGERSELTHMEQMIGTGNIISKIKVKKGEEARMSDLIRRRFPSMEKTELQK